MIAVAPSSDRGTVMLGITVAATLRRNMKITITTSAMVSMSVNCTSFTEARMVCVRSTMMSTFISAGMTALSCGIASLI